MVVTISVTKNY